MADPAGEVPFRSAGALLRHSDLAFARDPLPELYFPIPNRAYQQSSNQNQPRPRIIRPPLESNDIVIQPEIFVVRDFNEREEPFQAYARIPGKHSVDLAHRNRPRGWGKVFFCQVYERVGRRTFQATPVPQFVAIKRLRKKCVQGRLSRGFQENPYVEVLRMRELGDNQHVLRCIEFLQDNEWLYIVTPMAAGTDRTLKEAITWFDADEMEEARICHIFEKILRILLYLEMSGICHRDLSPDNFLFLTDTNLVAFDLALSIRIPVDSNNAGQRTLIRAQNPVGTPPFMAPEIYNRLDFDGVAIDLWAAGLLLYSLLTNWQLYEEPHDLSYRLFVAARCLSTEPDNDEARAMLRAVRRSADAPILTSWSAQAQAHARLSDVVIAYLENLLAQAPGDRFSLAEAYQGRPLAGHIRP